MLRSKHRTEEYMADLEKKVFAREWNLPHDCALGMLTYAMVQEHATFINYRNLKQRVIELGGVDYNIAFLSKSQSPYSMLSYLGGHVGVTFQIPSANEHP